MNFWARKSINVVEVFNWKIVSALPVRVAVPRAPKCTLQARIHCRRRTATVFECPSGSRQWSRDGREAGLGEGSRAASGASGLSSDSMADSQPAPTGCDEVESVFLAWHSSTGCSLCVAARTSTFPADWDSAESVDDAKEIAKSMQSH